MEGAGLLNSLNWSSFLGAHSLLWPDVRRLAVAPFFSPLELSLFALYNADHTLVLPYI